jgi:hypothetical protein
MQPSICHITGGSYGIIHSSGAASKVRIDAMVNVGYRLLTANPESSGAHR